MSAPDPIVTPGVNVPVVKTEFRTQMVRVIGAFVTALGAALAFLSANQPQLEAAFHVKWIGAALVVGGLVLRFIQEVAAAFQIHFVASPEEK